MRTHELFRKALPDSRRPSETEPRRDGSSIVPLPKSRHAMSCASVPGNKMSTFSSGTLQGQIQRILLAWWNGIRRLHEAHFLVTCLFALSLFFAPAAAVQLAAFDNCLPDMYKDHDPTPLQWVPLYVDAVFDTQSKSHGLRVTTWGNVTGSYNKVALPAAGDPEWSNPEYTHGKIQQEPEPDMSERRATTLVTKVNVLTYEPYYNKVDFCKDGLINGSGVCPLAPVFDTSALDLPYGLPEMGLSHEFFSTYSLATFAATFIIIYGDSVETNIGCVSVPITPDLGNFAWMLTFLPFVALIFVGFATVLAATYSPWGTTDIFLWSSNHGRDVDLLRLITPGFSDCLQYIQFAALTGALSLRYPGFYQPITSQVAWSSLMFNQSFVSNGPAYESLVDGIYVTNSTRGLVRFSQLVGMSESKDVWAGMMIWLLVIIAGVLVLTQLGFVVRRLYRLIRRIPKEDLRSKNVPFSLGNIIRIAFNYFLLPIVALSTFQLVAAGESPAYVVALAVVTLILVIGFTAWLLRIIVSARPRSDLFDDLPTVLLYGPLYNTYTDAAAGFAIVPVVLGILRGIAIGGLQASGIAQIAILASAEVMQLLTLVYFRPFDRQTSMNAYHSLFSLTRLITTLLMIAFAPSLGVTEGAKGWVGYAILLIHGSVLILGFFLNALQTLIEVIARLLGAGGDDMRGLTRGGLSKIFGMRQLSRRMSRRHHGVSRQSQLSTTAMLDADRTSKTGYVMPGGRLRSESVASIGGLMSKQHRSSSALDSIDIYSGAPASSFTPTTPGEANPFSFLPSPTHATRVPAQAAVADNAMEPYYYRPPRRRRETLTESINSNTEPASLMEPKRYSQPGAILGDPSDLGAALSRGTTPAPHGSLPINLAPRADYTTREVDFYYGVRGPALNSERPGRKLGTGPADPTGPVATAQGWLRSFLSGKTKDKGKGFEVVRSARMPPAMRMQASLDDDPATGGTPVAMSNLKNGPAHSDDEDIAGAAKIKRARSPATLLNERGEPQDMDAEGPGLDDLDAPDIPRKSSKRHSGIIDHSRTPSFNLIPPVSPVSPIGSPERNGHASKSSVNEKGEGPPLISRLPFERTDSMRHNSSVSSMDIGDDFIQIDLHREETNRDKPTSGHVPQHSISRVEPDQHAVDLLGSSAELVDDQYASSQGGSADGRR